MTLTFRPRQFAQHFGIAPRTRKDYEYLLDHVGLLHGTQRERDLRMAVDCYDDCIAYLDEQLGQLLENSGPRGFSKTRT